MVLIAVVLKAKSPQAMRAAVQAVTAASLEVVVLVLWAREVKECQGGGGRGGDLCPPHYPSVALPHSVSSLLYVFALQAES